MLMRTSMYRLAAVVELIDGFLDQPARVHKARFAWNGQPCQAIAKPHARYVFLALAPGAQVLHVDAPPFLPCKMDVVLPDTPGLANRLIRCVLKPGPHYMYPAHVTLIRGRIRDAPDGARVSADYRSSHGCAHHVEAHSEREQDYLLVLPGKLADPTEVTLRLDLPNGERGQHAVSVTPGHTLRVDILPK